MTGIASRAMRFGTSGFLFEGDCLDILPVLSKDAAWKVLVGPQVHIICDPPYEQILHDSKSSAARRIRTDGRGPLKGLDFAPIDEIRDSFIDAAAAIADGWVISFCTAEGVRPWADVINASPLKYKRACVWVKPDSTPQLNGQGPAMGAENFVCAWAGAGYSRWNAGGKRGVYTHLCNPKDRDGTHPTEKPIALMAEIIGDFTCPGDLVIDPFMGSGATGIAALRMGRRFIGIEMNPDYYDLACHRIADALTQPELFAGASPKREQGRFDLGGEGAA